MQFLTRTTALVIGVPLLFSGVIQAAESDASRETTPVKAMMGYDAQHTGYVPLSGPRTEPDFFIQSPTGFAKAVFDMAPSIDGMGNLYSDIGSSWRADEEGRSGGAIAFDVHGKERWRCIFPELQYGLSVPAIGVGGQIVMGFRDGLVRSFHPGDGELAWAYPTGSALIAAPLIDAQGDIYISTLGKGGIYKLDGSTGAPIWTLPFESGSGASPALSQDGKTVYAGWAEHEPGLYALDAATGELKWKWAPAGEFYFDWCSPVVGHDGTIYQQSEKNGTLYALEDGGEAARLKWSYVPAGEVGDSPRTVATDGEAIFIGASGTDPSFTALTLDGKLKWQYGFLSKVEMANIIVNDDTVYFPVVVPDGGAGWIYALDKHDGRQLWRKKVTHDDADVGGVSLGKDGILYAGTSGTVAHPYQGVLVALK